MEYGIRVVLYYCIHALTNVSGSAFNNLYYNVPNVNTLLCRVSQLIPAYSSMTQDDYRMNSDTVNTDETHSILTSTVDNCISYIPNGNPPTLKL